MHTYINTDQNICIEPGIRCTLQLSTMKGKRENNTVTVYCIPNTYIIIELSYLQGSTKYKYHHIYHSKICFQP